MARKPGWLGYTKPITKLFLVGYGDDGPSKGCQDRYGELVSTADLNQGAGGRYIYLCASRRPFGRGSAPAVTDVRIQTSSSCPAGWKSPEKFDGLNGDLNQGAGGKDIFMCYKTGNSNSGWEAGDLYSVRVVTGKYAGCPSGSSRVTALDGLDGDLNQKAGGDFIYLCQAPWSQGSRRQRHPKDSYYYYDSNDIQQLLARATTIVSDARRALDCMYVCCESASDALLVCLSCSSATAHQQGAHTRRRSSVVSRVLSSMSEQQQRNPR